MQSHPLPSLLHRTHMHMNSHYVYKINHKQLTWYIYIYIYKLVSFPDPSLYIVPILFHKFMVEVIQYWR